MWREVKWPLILIFGFVFLRITTCVAKIYETMQQFLLLIKRRKFLVKSNLKVKNITTKEVFTKVSSCFKCNTAKQ